jgi:hypothetical protein
VIIDGGSGENVVSKEMVSKLGLKTEKHPAPYKIGWIKQGTETLVIERYCSHFQLVSITRILFCVM